MNSLPVYVIDTSYLLELFQIPGYSTEEAVFEVRRRIAAAAESNARLYVSVPTIYELCNLITRVTDNNARSQLATAVRDTVLSSLDEGMPWTIVLSHQTGAFKEVVNGFSNKYAREGLSLSDGALIDEARRLRQTTYRGPGWRVHIWTKDRKLKAREPDNESNAYLG